MVLERTVAPRIEDLEAGVERLGAGGGTQRPSRTDARAWGESWARRRGEEGAGVGLSRFDGAARGTGQPRGWSLSALLPALGGEAVFSSPILHVDQS